MKVTGKTIYNMDGVLKVGMMDLNIKVIMFMVENKVEVLIHGLMGLNMKEVIYNILNLILLCIILNYNFYIDWDNNKICGKGIYVWADGR